MSEPHSATERVCARPGCGVRFTPKTARRVYCSDSCRTAANRSVPNTQYGTETQRIVSSSRPARAAGTAIAIAAVSWEPPSTPRGLSAAAEQCPKCRRPLTASPRGTLRSCAPCGGRQIPPHVAELYARDTPATSRKVRSDRERDDDAKTVVVAAGQFLRRIDALLADDRMHPDSRELLDWYAEEITAAKSKRDGRRLADLAEEFADDQGAGQFRRVGRWGSPGTAITAGTVVDEDEYDEDQAEPAAILATPAALQLTPARATWADALGALGYRLDGPAGACVITDRSGRNCGQPTGGSPPIVDSIGRDGWTCPPHYNELGRTITAINRNRGITQ